MTSRFQYCYVHDSNVDRSLKLHFKVKSESFSAVEIIHLTVESNCFSTVETK